MPINFDARKFDALEISTKISNPRRRIIINYTSSGIRQKGESQNGCFKKAKHAKISEKQTSLTP